MGKLTLTDIKNLFAVIFLTSMFIGVVIFSAYFIKIQYFPVSNLASILYLPVIAGLTGFLLFAGLAVPIGFAPYFWSELLKFKSFCHRIVGEENTEFVMYTYETGFIDLTQESRAKIFCWYVSVMLICLGLWWIAVRRETSIFWEILLALGLIGKYLVFLHQKENALPIIGVLKNKKIAYLWEPVNIILYSLLPSLALLFSILALINLIEIKCIILKIVCAILVVFVSAVCLLPVSKKKKLLSWSFMVSIVFIILFVIFFGMLASLSSNIIQIFKFGNINNASIVVDAAGCDVFKLNGFEIDCKETQKRYMINEVNVLWRANEYYVQDANHKAIEFIFSEKNVLSISIPEQPKSS